jgi:hypothetical protein
VYSASLLISGLSISKLLGKQSLFVHPENSKRVANKVVKSQIFFMVSMIYFYKTSTFQNIEHGHGAQASHIHTL